MTEYEELKRVIRSYKSILNDLYEDLMNMEILMKRYLCMKNYLKKQKKN